MLYQLELIYIEEKYLKFYSLISSNFKFNTYVLEIVDFYKYDYISFCCCSYSSVV